MIKKMIIIIIFMGTCLISLQSITAANVTVHPGESIQTAVNGASDGDNIIVYDDNNKAYTYKESISINKKVYIKSNGNVTIEANNSSSAVFTVHSGGSGSSIQNFKMTKTNYCIMISNANSCIISNNIISGASLVGIQFYGDIYNSKVTGNTITGVNPSVGNGISFEYGTVVNNTISGNNISNFLNGIIFNNNSENNTVSNNRVTCTGYNGVGIYTTDNARSMTITGNTVTGAEDGIAVQQMGTNTATNFNLSGNTVTGNKNGFWVLLTDSTISNNTASGNLVSGLDITGRNNKILNNTASNNGNTGITLAGYSSADYNTVSGNILNNNTAGINSASNYTTISNNLLNYNSDNGIISTADHVTISGNNVTNTNGSGVLLGVFTTQ
ncbi:MAG: right-handed parallel beta-helix repeat-containing protein [Methanobacterium sp. ERen5]|nr:MAG: right-handed parallel beta-helix repeat-containing protein [Methanobacterium sp. ERen5]